MLKTPISSKEIDEKSALTQAATLCGSREYCASQISERLARWGLDEEARERVICRLVDERFIDEARFCRAYALDKLRYNHWGRAKIRQMLRLLAVPAADREAALSELPDDEYSDILQHLARQKWPTIRGRSDYERRGKLMRFLAGRGFELDEMGPVIDDLGLS